MKMFKDSEGQEWKIVLTLGSAMHVRDKLGIDLLQPEEGDPPLLTRLGTDEILLGEVLCALLETQIEKNGITENDIRERFDGQTTLAAQVAFYDELSDFFRLRGRTDRAKACRTQQAMIGKAIELAAMKIDAMDVNKIVDGVMSGSLQEPSA